MPEPSRMPVQGNGVVGVVRQEESEVLGVLGPAREDGLAHRGQAARLPHRADRQRRAADEHHADLEHVGHHHRAEPPADGVAPDHHHREPDREQRAPPHQVAQQHRGGVQHDGEVGDQDEAPAQREREPHRLVVAAAEELGDGVDARAPVERHEQEAGDQERRHRAEPVEVRLRQPEAVGAARHRDEVGGADVAADDRHADRPER